MNLFSVYETGGDKPGHVLRTGSVSSAADVALQAGDGEDVIAAAVDAGTEMVAGGMIVPRPATGLAMEVEVEAGAPTLVEVPARAKVQLAGEGNWAVVPDGLVEVELVAGEVLLCHVRPPWPVMEYELRVHAA